jgi:predicted TIM-barrel fold metal-dependent hydrolase
VKPAYIVDADAHLLEDVPALRKYLADPWQKRTVLLPSDGFDRDYGGELGQRPTGPQDHLAAMDAEGIDLAVFYPTRGLGLGRVREREWSVAFCRAYNDWLAEFCSANPERLKGVALMPLLDVKASCEELNRAGKLGLVGAIMPSYFWFGPSNLGEPYFDDFYAEAERLGVAIGIHAHGSMTADGSRFGTFLQVHLMSHVPEQMNAMVAVLLGGVFERFPKLKLAFLEAGCGWLPFWVEHMDEEYEKRWRDVPNVKHKPSEYLANCEAYFGMEGEERLIPLVTELFGADKLLFASDYPHWDGEYPHAVRNLTGRADLSDTVLQKLMCDNALRFYGIESRVPAVA